jgi:hypothetical protein
MYTSPGLRLDLTALRQQLDALLGVCDELITHLDNESDHAAARGDVRAASGLRHSVLQVTRVRNDVQGAYRDLDGAAAARHLPDAAAA